MPRRLIPIPSPREYLWNKIEVKKEVKKVKARSFSNDYVSPSTRFLLVGIPKWPSSSDSPATSRTKWMSNEQPAIDRPRSVSRGGDGYPRMKLFKWNGLSRAPPFHGFRRRIGNTLRPLPPFSVVASRCFLLPVGATWCLTYYEITRNTRDSSQLIHHQRQRDKWKMRAYTFDRISQHHRTIVLLLNYK